jgi:hypothetical protein
MAGCALAQSSLPDCPTDTNIQSWNHCLGTHTDNIGNKYVGEYRNGINGKGTLTFVSGNKYVGEFKDRRFNGQGAFIFSNGSKYVGEFKDGKYRGQGILYRADGTVNQSGFWDQGNLINSFSLNVNLFPFNHHNQTAELKIPNTAITGC